MAGIETFKTNPDAPKKLFDAGVGVVKIAAKTIRGVQKTNARVAKQRTANVPKPQPIVEPVTPVAPSTSANRGALTRHVRQINAIKTLGSLATPEQHHALGVQFASLSTRLGGKPQAIAAIKSHPEFKG